MEAAVPKNTKPAARFSNHKAMEQNQTLHMEYLNFTVVDARIPIVEVSFNQSPNTPETANRMAQEAGEFMEKTFPGQKGYFLNCYDQVKISRDLIDTLKKAFLAFNAKYSHGDVRYGGTLSSKAFWISTAVQEKIPSRVFQNRAKALAALEAMAKPRRKA